MTSADRHAPRYPKLRNLHYSPVKDQEEQLVVLWDPSGLSQDKLILPLNYFFVIQHLDGDHSPEQIGSAYLKRFGEFFMPDRLSKLIRDLDDKLFLEGERVEKAKQDAQQSYRALPARPAVLAGRSYERDPEKLRAQLTGFWTSKEGPDPKPSEHRGQPLKGLAAPHYDLREAGPICAWAYKELQDATQPDLYIILGTSHTELARPYCVTDKDFETPLGVVPTDNTMVELLNAQGSGPFFEEDLAHKQEHTIETQLPLLQYTVGSKKPFTILPVLCSFHPLTFAEPPVAEQIEIFISATQKAVEARGAPVCVIASIELAHLGLRYGDNAPPTDFSFHRCMQNDLQMLKFVEELKAEEFARFIAQEEDRRRISGFAALYTLVRLIGSGAGQVLRYDRGITDQFNSTVTYASMAFY